MQCIENWGVVDIEFDPYRAPETRRKGICGNVYNSNKFREGANIITSAIVNVSDGILTTASGSEYMLGQAHPDYEKLYPNALNRLQNQFKKE